VNALRRAQQSWNKRDFAGVIDTACENLTYTHPARIIALNTREKSREWTQGWAKAFSEGRITNPRYSDAGNVVAHFTVEGTNDGPLGAMKPTGSKMSLPFCAICHFDEKFETQAVGGASLPWSQLRHSILPRFPAPALQLTQMSGWSGQVSPD
jgi:hypothetical protein